MQYWAEVVSCAELGGRCIHAACIEMPYSMQTCCDGSLSLSLAHARAALQDKVERELPCAIDTVEDDIARLQEDHSTIGISHNQ